VQRHLEELGQGLETLLARDPPDAFKHAAHGHKHDSSRRHRDARMTRDFAVAMLSAFGRFGGKDPYDD
jgi:hypothetical protein